MKNFQNFVSQNFSDFSRSPNPSCWIITLLLKTFCAIFRVICDENSVIFCVHIFTNKIMALGDFEEFRFWKIFDFLEIIIIRG